MAAGPERAARRRVCEVGARKARVLAVGSEPGADLLLGRAPAKPCQRSHDLEIREVARGQLVVATLAVERKALERPGADSRDGA